MRYDFEWNPGKAKTNFHKHKISFERATAIFRDPNLLSIPDDKHSETEESWLTMGLDKTGMLLVISHTFINVSDSVFKIRIISARVATKTEAK
jgi:uncharacterized DUF497 family protein